MHVLLLNVLVLCVLDLTFSMELAAPNLAHVSIPFLMISDCDLIWCIAGRLHILLQLGDHDLLLACSRPHSVTTPSPRPTSAEHALADLAEGAVTGHPEVWLQLDAAQRCGAHLDLAQALHNGDAVAARVKVHQEQDAGACRAVAAGGHT
jgi:hypothetical protein